jgi:protein SCO1/2
LITDEQSGGLSMLRPQRQYIVALMTTCIVAVNPACSFADAAIATAVLESSSASAGHDRQAAAQTLASTAQYVVPDVKVIRQDGKDVWLSEEMNDGRPVVLNFIFTACGSVCPLMSQVFGQFQTKLGAAAEHAHLMSISTDPEEDSPARLREYAHKFGAREGWNHYTGTLEASQSTQRAFGVYRGDKMSHTPVTLLRAAPGSPWLRIEGFVTPGELLRQYNLLLASR